MLPSLLSLVAILLSISPSTNAAITLNRVTNSAPWSIRQEHGIQVYPRSLTFTQSNGQSVTWQPGFLMMWGGMGSNGQAINDAWVSSDSGTSWQVISGPLSRYTTNQLKDGARSGHCANPVTGEIYVTSGTRNATFTNQLWYSSNGTDWFQRDSVYWPRERGPCVVDRSSNLYVIGGNTARTATAAPSNDVWVGRSLSSTASNRSMSWSLMTLRAPFYARQGHQLASYYSEYLKKNILYMANGFTTGARYNDIWISADDAVSWQRLNAAASYERRMDTHLTAMKNGVLFTSAGDCGGTCNKNDLWASVDGGYTWGECCANCGFTIREDHVQIIDSSGRFLVMGGSQENQPNKDDDGLANDIWRSSITLNDAAQVIKACGLKAPTCNMIGLTCLPDGYCPCSPFGKQVTMKSINSNPGWVPRFEGGVGQYPKPLKFEHADTGAPITLPAGAIIMWGGRQNYTGITLNDVWATSTGAEWFLVGGRANFNGVQARTNGQPIDDLQRTSDCYDPKNGKLYSVAGMTKDGTRHTSSVQVSADGGMSWSKLKDGPWQAREACACNVDSKGRLFVYGGHYTNAEGQNVRLNDVWMMSGSTWSRQTASAPWAARTQLDGDIWYSPSLKADVIYMANGIGANPNNPTNRFNDVWASMNSGVSWTRLTANAPYIGRQDGELLITDSGLVVVVAGDSGQNLPGNVNDIYASMDGGISWSMCNLTAGFYPREDHVAIFTSKGNLLVTQGEAPQTTMDNQVWVSKENFNDDEQIAAACGLTIPKKGVGMLCWPGRSCPTPDPEDESSTGGNEDDDESSSTGPAVKSDSSSLSSTTIIIIAVVVIVVLAVAAYFLRSHMRSKQTSVEGYAPADHQMTQILTQDSGSSDRATM